MCLDPPRAGGRLRALDTGQLGVAPRVTEQPLSRSLAAGDRAGVGPGIAARPGDRPAIGALAARTGARALRPGIAGGAGVAALRVAIAAGTGARAFPGARASLRPGHGFRGGASAPGTVALGRPRRHSAARADECSAAHARIGGPGERGQRDHGRGGSDKDRPVHGI